MFDKKQWQRDNIDKVRKYQNEYNKTHRSQRLANKHQRLGLLKHEAFMAYGGERCSCCGETEPIFLTIDHIAGGGTKHRKELGQNGSAIYLWLKRQGYPSGYRVLCRNCNWGVYKGDGICPHNR